VRAARVQLFAYRDSVTLTLAQQLATNFIDTTINACLLYCTVQYKSDGLWHIGTFAECERYTVICGCEADVTQN
jgi:hypothetical protein